MHGLLSRMKVTAADPVAYTLDLESTSILLNNHIGKPLKIHFTQNIFCQGCHAKIKKTYQNGFCYPCTKSLAACDLCIVKPERCHFHLGTCREPQWGLLNCMNPHVVYLANSSGIKVGITRKTQIPTRWIDQGACQALPLFLVTNRRVSGLVEIIIAKTVADKTNWRKMLMGAVDAIDLETQANAFIPFLENEFKPIMEEFGTQAIQLIEERKMHEFTYPVLEYPKKITSLSLDKTPLLEGVLLGIKGQYLIFDSGVINVRKYTGYEVIITA